MNWPGLLCVANLGTLLFLSLAYRAPWWTLAIADGLGHVEVSPMDTDINVLGTSVNIPLLWYMNLGSKLTLVAAVAAMLIYSVQTTRSFSKKLLDSSYKKPVYVILSVVVVGIATKLLGGSLLPFEIPLVGTSKAVITQGGATISVHITAQLTWVFWLAVLGALLALATKLYHLKFIDSNKGQWEDQILGDMASIPTVLDGQRQ